MIRYNEKVFLISEIALTVSLSLIIYYNFRILKSVTLDLVPIFIISFKSKFRIGVFCGFVYGIFRFLLSFHISQNQNIFLIFLGIFLDYIAVHSCIALVCPFLTFLKKTNLNRKVCLNLSIVVILIMRFIIYVFSGIIVWSPVSVPILDSFKFSFFYNLVYCVPQSIATLLFFNVLSENFLKNLKSE